MIDVEYISELAVAFLHGVQDKKKKLDEFYQRYEVDFEQEELVMNVFQKTTGEISMVVDVRGSRWRKKSDFYSLFLVFCYWLREIPAVSGAAS